MNTSTSVDLMFAHLKATPKATNAEFASKQNQTKTCKCWPVRLKQHDRVRDDNFTSQRSCHSVYQHCNLVIVQNNTSPLTPLTIQTTTKTKKQTNSGTKIENDLIHFLQKKKKKKRTVKRSSQRQKKKPHLNMVFLLTFSYEKSDFFNRIWICVCVCVCVWVCVCVCVFCSSWHHSWIIDSINVWFHYQ